MYMLRNLKGLETPTNSELTAEECRRTFGLGKKLFCAFLISDSLTAKQINIFQTFLTLISSLEKSIRAHFQFTQDLAPLTLMILVQVEEILEEFESPISGVFRDDLINLKFSLEHFLRE